MGLLSKARNVLSIIRDLVLIAFFAAALFGVVSFPSIASKPGAGGLGEGLGEGQPDKSLPPSVPEASPFSGAQQEYASEYAGEKITDPGLQSIYDEARNAFDAGNTEQGLSALSRLEDAFKAKGMGNEVNVVRNLRQAIGEQNQANIRRYGTLLQDMFGE